MSSDTHQIPVRKTFVHAVLCLSISWTLFILFSHQGLWQLYFVPLLFSGYAVFKDVYKKRYFNAFLIFLFFSLLVVLVDNIWLYLRMNLKLPFFKYMVEVRPYHVYILSKAQMILTSGTYAGYITVMGVRSKDVAFKNFNNHTTMDLMWLPDYLIGLTFLVALIVTTGGFGHIFTTLGPKYERAAHRGWMILLQYFAYVGIIIWYKKNIYKSALYRYGVMILLSLPMLLSGSRGDILIIILGAFFLDELYGRRIRLKSILIYGAIGTVVFAFYQNFRANLAPDTDLVLSIYKDLSMGIGYVISKDNGIYGQTVHLYNLILSFIPMLPSTVKEFLAFPQSHNAIFTRFVFPEAGATFSNGVWGEALYIIPFWTGLLYYAFIGVLLGCIDRFVWKKSVLIAAVATGTAVRMAKGGLTAGVANLLMFLAPMFATCLVAVVIGHSRRALKPIYVPKEKDSLHQ